MIRWDKVPNVGDVLYRYYKGHPEAGFVCIYAGTESGTDFVTLKLVDPACENTIGHATRGKWTTYTEYITGVFISPITYYLVEPHEEV